MSCLGLGNKWDWTISLVTFEMILPAVAGPEFYENYFMGKEAALAPEVLEALDVALHLYCGGKDSECLEHTWFNPDINKRTWDEGVRKLSEEKALLAPMGDWAMGYLESEAGGNLRPGVDFDVVPFPGTAGTYVFARTDIDPELFDTLQNASIKAFSTSKKVRALSGILVGSTRDSLHPELSASLREESTDIIERFLRANYPFD